MGHPLSVHADLVFQGPSGGGVVRGRGDRVTVRFDSWSALKPLVAARFRRTQLRRLLQRTHHLGLRVYVSLPGLPTMRIGGWRTPIFLAALTLAVAGSLFLLS